MRKLRLLENFDCMDRFYIRLIYIYILYIYHVYPISVVSKEIELDIAVESSVKDNKNELILGMDRELEQRLTDKWLILYI